MFNNKHVVATLLLSAMLTVTACSTRFVRGSGELVTETRQVINFESIDMSGSGEVIVTQGGSETLSIETDDNIMEFIRVEVRGGTLELGFEEGINFIEPTRLVFYVGVDDISGLTVSGSGDFEADQIETDRLHATVSGSGDVQITELTAATVMVSISGSGEVFLAGDASDQEVTVSGSGKYLAGDLCSPIVRVTVSGSGDTTVCATEMLNTNISGSGNVDYYGHPSINTSGGGSGMLNSLGDK